MLIYVFNTKAFLREFLLYLHSHFTDVVAKTYRVKEYGQDDTK